VGLVSVTDRSPLLTQAELRWASVTCSSCEHVIEGTIYLLGGSVARCSDCVPPHVREWAATECESCGRSVVVVARDGRVRHTACSHECRAELRERSRRVHHEPRPCAECGEPFVPTRRDAETCGGRCRTRRWRRLGSAETPANRVSRGPFAEPRFVVRPSGDERNGLMILDRCYSWREVGRYRTADEAEQRAAELNRRSGK
jgi:hypothetical protein